VVGQVSNSLLSVSTSFDLISRLRALVSKRDWSGLEEWSKTRKSPIGWEVSHTAPIISFMF
jgi:hypothetical protein